MSPILFLFAIATCSASLEISTPVAALILPPTKLEVGYSGEAYHAWISVYLHEVGWVDNIIEFDGKDWSLMDPTLAASNSASSVKKYIGDGSNYTVKYSY